MLSRGRISFGVILLIIDTVFHKYVYFRINKLHSDFTNEIRCLIVVLELPQ